MEPEKAPRQGTEHSEMPGNRGVWQNTNGDPKRGHLGPGGSEMEDGGAEWEGR